MSRIRFCAPLAAVLTAACGLAQAQGLVNIKGFGADGAGVTAPLTYPLPVGTTISMTNPVRLALKAGDYLLSDAWGQPGALYDAWNYEAGGGGTGRWDAHFYAAVQQGLSNNYTLLLDAAEKRNPVCIYPNCSYATEADAAAAFLATPAFRLHLAQDTVVAFSSTDYFLPDNLGGMSIRISAVPEPSGMALMLGGLAALAGWIRRRPGNVRPAQTAQAC